MNYPRAKCSWFTTFANTISRLCGHPLAFALALATIVVWAASGPLFHFSDTWQLVINTSTTIVTFLMVFLIQNTQNRDSEAIHIKLDELIHVIDKANNALLDIEELDEKDLHVMRADFGRMAREAREAIREASEEGKNGSASPG